MARPRSRYQPLGGDLLTLLHSYAHRTIRRLAAFAGIERDGLAEYLAAPPPLVRRLRRLAR